eukprot:jgi/Psemu1/307182/fgenesh1_kg.309_\
MCNIRYQLDWSTKTRPNTNTNTEHHTSIVGRLNLFVQNQPSLIIQERPFFLSDLNASRESLSKQQRQLSGNKQKLVSTRNTVVGKELICVM